MPYGYACWHRLENGAVTFCFAERTSWVTQIFALPFFLQTTTKVGSSCKSEGGSRVTQLKVEQTAGVFFFQIPLESATKRQTWEATGAKKTCVFLLYFTTPIIKLSLSFSPCRHFLSGFLLEALLKASECNNEGLCSFYSHHV